MDNLAIVEQNGKVSLMTRVKDAAFVGSIIATTALVGSPAFAAGGGELDLSSASTELTGVKTAVLGIIGTLVVLVGIGIAWSYFKRTAK